MKFRLCLSSHQFVSPHRETRYLKGIRQKVVSFHLHKFSRKLIKLCFCFHLNQFELQRHKVLIKLWNSRATWAEFHLNCRIELCNGVFPPQFIVCYTHLRVWCFQTLLVVVKISDFSHPSHNFPIRFHYNFWDCRFSVLDERRLKIYRCADSVHFQFKFIIPKSSSLRNVFTRVKWCGRNHNFV